MVTAADVLEEGTRNNRWINENMEQLREEYGGKFIAVENGEVIFASDDQEEVIEEAEAQAETPESVIVTFIYESGKKILR